MVDLKHVALQFMPRLDVNDNNDGNNDGSRIWYLICWDSHLH